MRHKSHLMPVISPNIKLCRIWLLTFLKTQVHLTVMTFILALVSKNWNGLGFLHSLIFRSLLKCLFSPHLLFCVLLQSGPERHPQPSLPWPKPPTIQKPSRYFGTALDSSSAPYFWLSAPLTWIQFHAFSTAVGFCWAKHRWRAFLTLWTCSHSYIS